MSKVADVMETVVYTCRNDETVGDVIKHIMDAHVGSLIVVDKKNRPVGHITDGDIVRFVTKKHVKVVGWGEMLSVILDEQEGGDLAGKIKDLLDEPVESVANRDRLYVDKFQDVEDAMELLCSNGVKKVAVVEGGRVIGVVTRSAIMRHLLGSILPE